MSVLAAIVSYFDVQPSVYFHWISTPEYVTESPEYIDQMAAQGLFPKLQQLYPSLLCALLLGVCRLFLQHFFFKPLAVYLLQLDQLDVRTHELVAAEFKKTPRPDSETLKDLAGRSKLSEAEIHKQLWALRRSAGQKKKYIKFTEAGWRMIFYASFCVVGYFTLFYPSPVPWVLSTKAHWTEWPIQEVYPMVRVYYIVELGAYFHQIMWTDVARSDSTEMLVHHFVTIFLMLFSYLTNFTRIGTTVLALHDISDVFLEFAKCSNYVSKVPKFKRFAQPLCDTAFGIFAVSFFILRLCVYPVWVFYYSYVYVAARLGKGWVGFWVFYCLLMALQLLHVFWFYLISRMLYKMLIMGTVDKDVRSDDDDDAEEEPTASGSASNRDDPQSPTASAGLRSRPAHKRPKKVD